MKNIVVFIALPMLIILVINGFSQSVNPTIDSSAFSIGSPYKIPPAFHSMNPANIPSYMSIKNEHDENVTSDVQCGSENIDHIICFPDFGITVTSNDIHVYPEANNHPGNEVSVIVDPNNNENLMEANMLALSGVSHYFSQDGGMSWSGESFDGYGESEIGGDPSAVISNDGTMFVSYLGLPNNANDCKSKEVQIAVFTGPNNYSQSIVASPSQDYFFDKPHLWIDNSTSEYNGNLYCSWTSIICDPDKTDHSIQFIKSTNNGQNWGDIQNISKDSYSPYISNAYNTGVNIQTGTNGEVYVAWTVINLDDQSYTDNHYRDEKGLAFIRSSDGGDHWDEDARLIRNIHGIAAYMSEGGSEWGFYNKLNSFPSMCVDKSNGPHRGRLYLVWANKGFKDTGNDSTTLYERIDVYMIYSDNQGTTWSHAKRVNLSDFFVPNPTETHAFFPWISCDDESGVLSVIYYDDHISGSGILNANVALSRDFGATWQESIVSDYKFIPAFDGYHQFGDYIGITSKDGFVYPTFTDCSPEVYISPFQMWPCQDDYLNITELIQSDKIRKWQARYELSAENKIESNGMVIYTAGDEITFKPIDNPSGDPYGFWAQSGSFVHAYIGGCQSHDNPPNYLAKVTKNNDLNDLNTQRFSESMIKLFPNPSTGNFQIDIGATDLHSCSLEITTALGTPVYSMKTLDKVKINIDISDQPKGVYFIKLYSHDKTYVNKMVCN